LLWAVASGDLLQGRAAGSGRLWGYLSRKYGARGMTGALIRQGCTERCWSHREAGRSLRSCRTLGFWKLTMAGRALIR
jgi:hypothetical protein